MKIANKEIGPGNPTFVIGDAANNHLCNMDTAKKMIKEACWCGLDAIKFQTYKAENLVTGKAMTYWEGEKIPQIDYYKKLDKFGKDEYKELFDYAKKTGIIAFSSPFDVESAHMLNELDVPVFKIASCNINDKRLIETIANFHKPIIMSCGGAYIYDINRALDWIFKFHRDVALMFCTFIYPTPLEKANLIRFKYFKQAFDNTFSKKIPIGFSDHTENINVPQLAVAMGANLLERHFTLDKNIEESGNFYATTRAQFIHIVNSVRFAEEVLGEDKGKYYIMEEEKETAKNSRKSIVANRDIKKGSIISAEDIGVKRPEGGVSPAYIDDVIGGKATKDIKKDNHIQWNDYAMIFSVETGTEHQGDNIVSSFIDGIPRRK